MDTASGAATGCAGCSSATADVTSPPARARTPFGRAGTARRAGTGYALIGLHLGELARGNIARARERARRKSDHAGCDRAHLALRRVHWRVGLRRGGWRMYLDNLEHRHAERDPFRPSSHPTRGDTNGPHVGNLVKMSRRASCMSIGSLAAHLIQTRAFAVALVAELLHEVAGIKVRPTRAVLMNVAVIRELWPSFCVELRQRAGVSKLQDYPEQRVRIRRTAGKIDDRLVRQEISHANCAGWIRIGRRNPSPTGTGADGDDSRSLARDVGEDVHGWPPGQFHVNALVPSGDRALDHADVLTGVVAHGLRERFFGLPARTRH